MFKFLKKKCKQLERIESRSIDKGEKSSKQGELRCKGASVANSKSHSFTKGTVSQKNASLTTLVSSGKCYFCNGDHFIYFCEKFLALSVNDRIKEVK